LFFVVESLGYLSSKWLLLIFLFPFLELLPESLQQPGMFALTEELGLLEPFIQKLQLFRVIRVVIVGDPGLVVLLGDHFVPGFRINGVGLKVLHEVSVSSLIENGPGHLSLGQDFEWIFLSEEPVPHHPARVHGGEEAPGTAGAFRPEWLQETVAHDQGEQRLSLPHIDSGGHPGRVQVGEVEDADVRDSWRWTSGDHGPLSVRQLLGFPLRGELGRLDGVLHQLLLVHIGGVEDLSSALRTVIVRNIFLQNSR